LSGYVALSLPSPGAVVTYFVAGSGPPSPQMDDRGCWRTEFRHDYGAMTGESSAVTRICERALPLPVKSVHRVGRLGLVQPRHPSSAGGQVQRFVGCGAWLEGLDR
jgi:hypothetical protein